VLHEHVLQLQTQFHNHLPRVHSELHEYLLQLQTEIIHFSDVTLDPASKGNVVGMSRQMTTAF
jgi:hypothetical protein